MSEENVERIRALNDRWNREDLMGVLGFFAPTIAFHTSGVFPSHDLVYRGHDGFRKFWETFHEAWNRLDMEVERLADLGDERVFILVNFDAVGRGSGVQVRRKFAFLYLFEAGLIVEIHAYANQAEGLKAVGLSE